MGYGIIGTVRQFLSSPASALHQSVAEQTHSASRKSTASCISETARILRAARLRDLLASIEEWRHASGPDRVWWRCDARHRLAEWRTRYRNPERAAFQAAVNRSRA